MAYAQNWTPAVAVYGWGTQIRPENESNIELTVIIDDFNQTVTINKYFANLHTVNRGDGNPIVELSSSITHTYTTPGTYTIIFSFTLGDSRRTFHQSVDPLVSIIGTTANDIYLSKLPELKKYFGANILDVWPNFFAWFNRDGALTSLPDWSFDMSYIVTADDDFFASFNHNGALTHIPTSLVFPSGNIVGHWVNDFMNAFNSMVAVIDRNTEDIINNVTEPPNNRYTFSYNQPWYSNLSTNWRA